MKATKHILLTGGNGVLGRSFINILLSNPAMSLTVLTRDPKKLLIDYDHAFSSRLRVIEADFKNLDSLNQIISSVTDKEVDALINNAGINLSSDPLDMTIQQMNDTFNVNFIAPFMISQLVSKHMIKNNIQGSIVNIASVKGLEASSDIAYGASKAALIQMTKSLAKCLSAVNIRVNAVAPGVLEHTSKMMSPEKRQAYLDMTSTKTFSTAEDIANIAIFLISDLSKAINGQCIKIDNGYKI